MMEHSPICRRENRNALKAGSALVVLCLALAGCGGGGGGGVNSANTTPGPTATPAQTPAPAFTGTSVGFSEIAGTYEADGTDALRTHGPFDLSGASLAIEVEEATSTYTVTVEGNYITAVFSPSTSVGPAQASDEPANFLYFRNDAGTGTDNLEVLRKGSGNSRIQLDHLTYGLWTTIKPHSSTEPRDVTVDAFVFGEPTDETALPASGTATYQGIVDGHYGTYRLLGSTGTLTADFGNRTVSAELSLRTNGLRIADDAALPVGAGFEIGTFSGSGDIGCPISCGTNDFGADNNAYWGSLSGSLEGNSVSGSFDGLFFGPNAEETGFDFAVGTYPYDPASGFAPGPSAAGVFVGKQ